MKLYKNYHVTGGLHDIEFVQNGAGEWHYRLKWAADEFFAIKSMKGVHDGDGVYWGEINGRNLFRLVEVDTTNQWDGAKYPKPEPVEPPPTEVAKSTSLSLEDLTKKSA